MLKVQNSTLNVKRLGKQRCALPFSMYALEVQATSSPSHNHAKDKSLIKLKESRENVDAFLLSNGGTEFTSKLHAAFIGGSLAKGTADQFSDTDLCLVSSEIDINIYLEKFNSDYEQRQHEHRIEIEFPKNNKLDIRLISVESLQNMLQNFQSFSDLSATVQDCLANFEDGIYLKSTPQINELVRKIDFTYDHAKIIVLDKLRYIKHYNLNKLLIRNDTFTYNEIVGMLYAAFCHIFYAINGRLFRGYRQIDRFSETYDIYPSTVISAFSDCFKSPTPSKNENLLIQILGFSKELEKNF